MSGKRGAVLIIVLGVLVVLALLGTTFATLTGIERDVSHNYLDLVRAKLVAESGIQFAVTRLEEMFPAAGLQDSPLNRSWVFYGNDLTETSPQPTMDVESSRNPSFAVEIDGDPTFGSVAPQQVMIHGQPCGISGTMQSGAYAAHGDQYVLKVRDLSGCLFVNDGVELGPNGSVSQNLKRILNLLGTNLGVSSPLGDRILAGRPAAPGYVSEAQLVKAIGNANDYNLVKTLLTLHAWVDPDVALPVPLSNAVYREGVNQIRYGGIPYTRNNLNRYGWYKNAGNLKRSMTKYTLPGFNYLWVPLGAHDYAFVQVHGLDTLNPSYIEVVRRAPINVNTAPREVLIALLTDLQGFFLLEKRRNNPRSSGDSYASFTGQTTCDISGTEGDEFGFLYSTNPIVGPGGINAVGVSAAEIADEIIACRDRRVSPFDASVNYASKWFGGPFQNWRQFNAFVDGLVDPDNNPATPGILWDIRNIYFDHAPDPVANPTMDPTGYSGSYVSSALAREFGVKAIADVLKANFNPNLHLNELNPDENRHLRVDKTDLIIHSTEFCFLPMGYLSIESAGRVLRPIGNSVNALAPGTDNTLVAQAKVVAAIRLYTPHRETNQKQFYAGTWAARSPLTAAMTSNKMSLEVGPEPDNGPAPGANEWSGYVALPTLGSNHAGASPVKPRNVLWRTLNQYGPAAAVHDSASVCVHFDLDFNAHYHKLGAAARKELARTTLGPLENVGNYPDPVNNTTDEVNAGPYDPTCTNFAGDPDNTLGTVRDFRLCRSYRQIPGVSLTLPVDPIPPSDLRIDGGYVERNCAAVYAASMNGNYTFSGYPTGQPQGTVSFWYKPSYFPELTGKERNVFHHARFHDICAFNAPVGNHVSPFNLWFFPAHFRSISGSSEVGLKPGYSSVNVSNFQPSSLVCGNREVHRESEPLDCVGGSWGRMTWSLNHIGHPCGRTRSPLQSHRWIHLALSFYTGVPTGIEYATDGFLYVNGSQNDVRWTWAAAPSNGPGDGPGSPPTGVGSMLGWGSNNGTQRFLWRHEPNDEEVHFALGAPSRIALAARTTAGADSPYRGNHSGDGTYDEFHVWDVRNDAAPVTQWTRGRYFKPLNGSAVTTSEGWFTSQNIPVPSGEMRNVAPPADGISPPPASPPTTSAGSPSGSMATPFTGSRRLYGASWTWMAEGVDTAGKPILIDSSDDTTVDPKVELQFTVDGAVLTTPVLTKDGFDSPRPGGVLITTANPVKYHVRFRIDGADINTILLATPVLDDVTLFFGTGEDPYVEYRHENVTLN